MEIISFYQYQTQVDMYQLSRKKNIIQEILQLRLLIYIRILLIINQILLELKEGGLFLLISNSVNLNSIYLLDIIRIGHIHQN
jgi:hypothetical protein